MAVMRSEAHPPYKLLISLPMLIINKIRNIFKTFCVFFYHVYLTLRISVVYLFYSHFYESDKLRIKGNALLHWWSAGLLNSLNFKFEVETIFPVKFQSNRNYIFMSNHCSFYDIPLVILAAKDHTVRMITKQELFRIPIWGRALKASEFIPLNRQNRRLALLQLKYAREKMSSGIKIWISPEGTRSKDGIIAPLKRGGFKLAHETDAIIVPIYLENTHKIFKNKCYQFNLKSKLLIGPHLDSREHSIDELKSKTFSFLTQYHSQN